MIKTVLGSFQANVRALKRLKDSRKGQRCFIVGNGPSLKQMDLTPLANESVFVTNMFILHPLLETIRPEYYCLSDWVHWKDNSYLPDILDAFKRLPDSKFFLESSARRATRKAKAEHRADILRPERLFYLAVAGDLTVWDDHYDGGVSAGGRPATVAWGKTVILDFCVPLADFLGFEKMYLIGNDYNWNLDRSADLNHGYFYDINRDRRGLLDSPDHIEQTRSDEHVNLIMNGFRYVAAQLSRRGKSIYNAGIGGALDVIPRISYKDLF